MRILCLYFPRIAVALAVRRRPELEGRPVAIVAGAGNDAGVIAVSASASAGGVVPGATAGEARRRCPNASFLPDNAGECLDELERAASMIRVRATPLVAIGGRDHLFVDLSGVCGLYAGESTAARRLGGLAQSWTGLPVRAGIASSRAAALSAARGARFHPMVDDATAGDEAPVGAFRDEPLGAEATFGAPLEEAEARARLVRMLARLQTVLDGRGQGFREARLWLVGGGGAYAVRERMAGPCYDTSGVAALVAGRLPGEAFSGATHLRVELARLCPDVRLAAREDAAVRPCATGRPSARGRQMLLRAG